MASCTCKACLCNTTLCPLCSPQPSNTCCYSMPWLQGIFVAYGEFSYGVMRELRKESRVVFVSTHAPATSPRCPVRHYCRCQCNPSDVVFSPGGRPTPPLCMVVWASPNRAHPSLQALERTMSRMPSDRVSVRLLMRLLPHRRAAPNAASKMVEHLPGDERRLPSAALCRSALMHRRMSTHPTFPPPCAPALRAGAKALTMKQASPSAILQELSCVPFRQGASEGGPRPFFCALTPSLVVSICKVSKRSSVQQ